MERLIIKAFRATEDPDRCVRFTEEHRRVLTDIGVADVIPHDLSWTEDDATIVIVAEHPILGMVGGCRLQFAVDKVQLPFFQHLSLIEPDIITKFGDIIPGACGELCGLWVAHRYARHGLPWILTSAAISVSTQTNIGSFVCLSAEYSKEYACRNGFKCMTHIGDNGALPFPTPDIRSFPLVNTDPIGLRSATDRERYKQFSLRLTPDQRRIEQPRDAPVEVQYILKLPQRVIRLNPKVTEDPKQQRRIA